MPRIAILIVLALSLGGCGADLLTMATHPPGMARATFEKCLHDNMFLVNQNEQLSLPVISARFAHGFVVEQTESPNAAPNPLSDPGPIHHFLDCYLAKVEPDRIDLRLLRGHILTVLLAEFSAEVLTVRTRSATPQDASRVIADVARAELLLSALSVDALDSRYSIIPAASDPSVRGNISTELNKIFSNDLPTFRNAQRTAAVLEVALDIEQVNAREFWNVAKSIFTALTTKSTAALSDILQSVGQGLLIAMNSDWYGTAFLRDAQLTIRNASGDTTGGTKAGAVQDGWRMWDTRLKKACADLQSLAKSTANPCIPSQDATIQYLKDEFGEKNKVVAQINRNAAQAAFDKAKKALDALGN